MLISVAAARSIGGGVLIGKAFVNFLCASMGTTVVGALGVSDRICALATNPITGFQEAETSLISNNLGNKNLRR